jgi:hypothetical protein
MCITPGKRKRKSYFAGVIYYLIRHLEFRLTFDTITPETNLKAVH